MSLRTIMIFPEFDNMDVIDRIRAKYDPLAELVRPHVTLVFPFESDISNEKLEEILESRLQEINCFELILGNISKQKDLFGNYLFLNVLKGAEELVRINRFLYDNEFKEYDLGLPYVPHMTIGKLSLVKEMDEAYEEIKDIQDKFSTVVKKISVEMIGENEESIIVIEKKLK